jgi:hypothetical protein
LAKCYVSTKQLTLCGARVASPSIPCAPPSKQIDKNLNSSPGTAAEGSCFARAFEDGLVDIVPTLDEVLCNPCSGFLCGFLSTSTQRAGDPLANSLYDFFAEIAG